MCSDPQTNSEGQTYACRRCNACLGARANDWVARACAHRHTVQWAGVLNLTYQEQGKGYDGARQFRYKDVSDMMKRLRERIYRRRRQEYKRGELTTRPVRPEIDYLICGERGSDTDRVHWHCVVYADENLYETGQWADFHKQWAAGYLPSDGPKKEFLVDPKPDRGHRKVWEMWPYGHVTIDTADEAGIGYALKYILKDQFSAAKSKRTNRFTKSENAASSHFAKTPSIGRDWLIQKLCEWRDEGRVPTSLQLKVEGYSGYWWPKDIYRDYLLDGLCIINEEYRKKHGKDTPQWKFLLGSLDPVSQEKEINRLLGKEYEYGQAEIENDTNIIERNAAEQRARSEQGAVRNRCGGLRPCAGCIRRMEPATDLLYRVWFEREARRLAKKSAVPESYGDNTFPWLDRSYRREGRVNPFCEDRHKKRYAYIYGSTFGHIREEKRKQNALRTRRNKS